MGRSQQRKGKSGELELVTYFNERGYETRRGASQSYGAEPDVIGLSGIHVEVKRVEKLNLSAAMAQALRDSERFHDGVPAVFHRKNREGWLVTMRLSDWIEIYEGRCKMLNHIIIMGRIAREPELKQTINNDAMVTFSIAVDRGKDKPADYFDCVAWKDTAEFIAKFGVKSRIVVVDGRMKLKEWIDRNEVKRKTPELLVNSLYFCDYYKAEEEPETLPDDLPF